MKTQLQRLAMQALASSILKQNGFAPADLATIGLQDGTFRPQQPVATRGYRRRAGKKATTRRFNPRLGPGQTHCDRVSQKLREQIIALSETGLEPSEIKIQLINSDIRRVPTVYQIKDVLNNPGQEADS